MSPVFICVHYSMRLTNSNTTDAVVLKRKRNVHGRSVMARSLHQLRYDFEEIGCLGIVSFIEEVIRTEEITRERVYNVSTNFKGARLTILLGTSAGDSNVADSLAKILVNW